MSTSCDEELQNIIESRKKIINAAFTSSRVLILTLLQHFKIGIQYRELKNTLNLSDGNLFSNLKNLIDMGYIEEETIQFDTRPLKIYQITSKGEKELSKIMEWIISIKKLIGDIEC